MFVRIPGSLQRLPVQILVERVIRVESYLACRGSHRGAMTAFVHLFSGCVARFLEPMPSSRAQLEHRVADNKEHSQLIAELPMVPTRWALFCVY